MKKFDIKSVIFGVVIATFGTATLVTALTANAADTIRSAVFSPARVYYNNVEVPLENQLISIVKEGETNAQLYMPVRELLEYMNFDVEWDGQNNSVRLTMKNIQNNDAVASSQTQPTTNASNANGVVTSPNGDVVLDFNRIPNMTTAEVDALAIRYINADGQFGFVYSMAKFMSTDGRDAVVNVYLEKTSDYGMIGAMLSMMSNKAAIDVANRYFLTRTSTEYDWIFSPFATGGVC